MRRWVRRIKIIVLRMDGALSGWRSEWYCYEWLWGNGTNGIEETDGWSVKGDSRNEFRGWRKQTHEVSNDWQRTERTEWTGRECEAWVRRERDDDQCDDECGEWVATYPWPNIDDRLQQPMKGQPNDEYEGKREKSEEMVEGMEWNTWTRRNRTDTRDPIASSLQRSRAYIKNDSGRVLTRIGPVYSCVLVLLCYSRAHKPFGISTNVNERQRSIGCYFVHKRNLSRAFSSWVVNCHLGKIAVFRGVEGAFDVISKVSFHNSKGTSTTTSQQGRPPTPSISIGTR